MRLYDLKTLHMKKCVGIDQNPYFSWKIANDKNDTVQCAYQLQVLCDEECLWDTGKVESEKQSFVEYEGIALSSRTEYKWKVTVWNNYNETAEAEAQFETGLLEKSLWNAKWVESTIPRVPVTEYKYGNTAPAVFFEKEFTLDKRVKKARMYATSYGVYQLRINKKRADDREFAPEFTTYSTVLYYQTYDVTMLLKQGKNTLDMYVGDGWYFSMQASPVFENQHEKPSVLFQLEVEYEDGTTEQIISDGDETCALGPICYSDIFQGEKQDYRIGYDEKHPVEVKDYGYEMLEAQPMPPVRPTKLLPAVDVFQSPNGEWIVDFGQVLAGRARIHIDEPKDTEIVLEYFEILDENGNYVNTMFCPQKDIVVSNGTPLEHEVKFTFHGFRYIRVTGMTEVKKENFTAVLLTTEKDDYGSFTCSDERVNRLYQNVRWSQWNNMMSVPTDCPAREKAGWTGDILVYAKTALMNEDVTPFLSSWLHSLRENQADDGVVMITAPYTKLYDGVLMNTVKEFGDTRVTGVAGWSDAIVWVPYIMHQVTGNTIVLKDNYEAMKKWCDYIIRTAKEKRGYRDIPYEYDQYLWNTGFHFGEWLIPSQQIDPKHPYENAKTTSYFMAPFFGYQSVRYFAEICGLLGKVDEQNHYDEIAQQMKNAIQNGIMRGGHMPDDLMGGYCVAIAFDLVPDDLKENYKEKLVSLIQKNDYCLDTGFLATPFLLDALCIVGEQELAHQVFWQDKRPSWLYEVDHGATAIWEAWDADEAKKPGRFVSFDHYALGCVDDWMERAICGIDTDQAGFKHFVIRPQYDSKLTSCERTFESEAGMVSVKWDEHTSKVEIPCNTTATVYCGETVVNIGSGTYQFER